LKLQIVNNEKLHEQYKWKLQQADDNLEMVEREQDQMEKKAAGELSSLKENNFFETTRIIDRPMLQM